MHRCVFAWMLVLAIGLGCDEKSATQTRARGLYQGDSLALQEAPVEGNGWAPVPSRSAAAQSCLDLFNEQAFAEAVEACGRAVEEDHDPELVAILEEVTTFAALDD